MHGHRGHPRSLRTATFVAATALGLTVLTGVTGATAANEPAAATSRSATASADAGQRSVDFNADWKFLRGDAGAAATPGFDDSSWRTLDVPHDWAINQDFAVEGGTIDALMGYLPGGTGWYRKTFPSPVTPESGRVTLDFDGVMQLATVYVNGTELGQHRYGYTPFSFDITDLLTTDGSPNVVAVKVESPRLSARWYTGAGIYRDVTLTVTGDVFVERDGTFVTTPTLEQDIDSGVANVDVETTVGTVAATDAEVSLVTEILDADGDVVASGEVSVAGIDGEHTFDQTITVPDPTLWSPDTPALYDVVSRVQVDGEEVDEYTTRTGFRSIRVDEDGFHLNGERVELRGADLHHDLGSLGAAVNRRATERQLELMQAAGINAVRTAHNPASREFIELADEMGLLVLEEAFDKWTEVRYMPNGYGKYFREDGKDWLTAMVHRDKNSPAVVMWSIGNEVNFPEDGVQIATDLNRWVKEIDPTRPTTIGENKLDAMSYEIANIVDVPSRNYPTVADYEQAATTSPSGTVIGSEVAWSVQSRGYYYAPDEILRGAYGGELQGSSYDNHVQAAQTTSTHAEAIQRSREADVTVAGNFIWTGMDHIGEPLPYHQVPAAGATEAAKGSYTGIVDIAGFPKDIYHFYRSQWLDEPVLHLLPHWNWSQGETVQVWAYTNADSVKLYLDDELVGERSFERKVDKHGEPYLETSEGKLHLSWDVPFQAGTLRAEAVKDGKVIATETVNTAGAPAALELTPDRSVIAGDGEDLSFVEVDVVDAEGVLVPRATNQITFDVTGGELVSVDNGNAASIERFQGTNKRKAFSGKALVVVRSDGSGEPIRITATADGLAAGTATVLETAPGVEEIDTVVELQSALDWYQAQGAVTGPLSAQLDRDLETAARLIEKRNQHPASVQLQRFIERLETPPPTSTVSDLAEHDLTAGAKAVLGTIES